MTAETVTLSEILGTTMFAFAVIHTFASSSLRAFATRFPEGSVRENLFHLLGEVEVVFGFWAGILILALVLAAGKEEAVHYAEGLNFAEPLFVFAIMAVAATRPVIHLARHLIFTASRILPLRSPESREASIYLSCLSLGPLLGSFITEPAAMTVTALILRDRYFMKEASDRFRYLTLAVLFVNVSIGGVLTPFAAPPVLMVASKWNWDLGFMIWNFGWKTSIAVLLNAALATIVLRKELRAAPEIPGSRPTSVPPWLTAVHILILGAIVLTSHHPVIFIGIFLFFLGIATITPEYQDELKIRESLLVAFFLGGLVVLGGLQSWWLAPLIRQLDSFPLFLGSTALTSITDNAALTYLGSQVEGIGADFKYALVAGAVAGGGLTVIANAPNPAGYSILQERFGEGGISPLKLLIAALIPTLVAMGMLWVLP